MLLPGFRLFSLDLISPILMFVFVVSWIDTAASIDSIDGDGLGEVKLSSSNHMNKPFVATLEEYSTVVDRLPQRLNYSFHHHHQYQQQQYHQLKQRSHRSLSDHNYYYQRKQQQHHHGNRDSRQMMQLLHPNENTYGTMSMMNNWPNTMKNITVTLGRNATFECVFPKLKDSRLVWFHQDDHTLLAMHDTVIIKNGRISVRSHANTTFYLTIHEVQESDRGFYMCQVNTKPMRIQIGYLEVNVPPSFIEEKTSSDLDVQENSSVSLQCQANGRPEPEITWRREEGHSIVVNSKENDSFPMVKGHHLNMINVTRHQMGVYLCIASNGIAPTISKRIFLGVSFAPVIWTRKEMIEASISSAITLECHIESYPRANVYWQKNNQLPPIIYSDRKYTIFCNDSNVPYRFVARLKINDIQKDDFDKYTCVSKNKMGTAKSSIRLSEMKRQPHQHQIHHEIKSMKPNYYEPNNNNNNRKKIHQNVMTTRIPNIRRTGETEENINKGSSREKINIKNYDEDENDVFVDDDEQDMWQYETNYLGPKLLPAKNGSTANRMLMINDQCFIWILILDILLTVFQ